MSLVFTVSQHVAAHKIKGQRVTTVNFDRAWKAPKKSLVLMARRSPARKTAPKEDALEGSESKRCPIRLESDGVQVPMISHP